MTLSITTLSNYLNVMLSAVRLSVVMVSVVMLIVIRLSVIRLNVIRLSVVRLKCRYAQCRSAFQRFLYKFSCLYEDECSVAAIWRTASASKTINRNRPNNASPKYSNV